MYKKNTIQSVAYNFVNLFFQNNFTDDIYNILNKSKKKKNINIFDIGSYLGNFSRELKKKLKNKYKLNFYLFDPNPFIKLKDFQYNCVGISDVISKKIYNYNNFFPSSGSGFNKITSDDFLWNMSRKLITFNIFKKFSKFKVYTDTLDNFCKKISKIDILKIDTEGHELEVLKGGKNILHNTNIIQIEIMGKKKYFEKKFKKVNDFLKKYNFEIIKKKKIWSVSLFSNIEAIDVLYSKKGPNKLANKN
jgi:FkbM family methyltransferase